MHGVMLAHLTSRHSDRRGLEKNEKSASEMRGWYASQFIFMGSDKGHAAMSTYNVLTRTVWVDVRRPWHPSWNKWRIRQFKASLDGLHIKYAHALEIGV